MKIDVSKNKLRFGRLNVYGCELVPHMDQGRNGDVVIIDSGTEENPESVGLWIKLPLTDERAPIGTVVNGLPGTISDTGSITINTVLVTLTDTDNLKNIVRDINAAGIPNVSATLVGGAVQIINGSGGAITVSDNSLGLYSISAINNMTNVGVWTPLNVSSRSNYVSRSIFIFIETPIDKTYPILIESPFEFEITSITTQTETGTVDVVVQINNVDVTGLSVSATNTRTTTKATGNNLVGVSDAITVVTSNANTLTDLSITITYTYRD